LPLLAQDRPRSIGRGTARHGYSTPSAPTNPSAGSWVPRHSPMATRATRGLAFRQHLVSVLAMDEEVVPVLYVEDAARAVAWYGRLGFVKEWEHQFEPGFPWFVSVARGNVRLYLSEHKGDARPDTLIHLYVKDIDAVSTEFGIPVDEEGLAGRECDLIEQRRRRRWAGPARPSTPRRRGATGSTGISGCPGPLDVKRDRGAICVADAA
jgi:catechol 2,3-dioxygenase-like lactoylglutathione lyase family enzyme